MPVDPQRIFDLYQAAAVEVDSHLVEMPAPMSLVAKAKIPNGVILIGILE